MKKTTLFTTAVFTAALMTTACTPFSKPQPTPTPTETPAEQTEKPKQFLDYRMDAFRENANGDSYPDASEELIQKVNHILSSCAHPQNDVFENVLGLYQYISQNITYKADASADTAEVLLRGTACAEGFSRAYQYLLNQIGAEAFLVTSNDESGKWVMVSMPDGYYHFDPAEEAKQTAGQSLTYFAMNDEQRWGGGKYDGWYIGSEEAGDKRNPPTNEKQTYVFLQDIKAGYGCDFENKCMYFADVSQDNELVKYNYQIGMEESVYGKRAGAMVYFRGIIYFSDLTQRNQLFRLNVQTGESELLDSVFVTRMMLKNGKLIYFDDVSSSEKGIQLTQEN